MKIAAIQINSGADMAANISKVEVFVAQAAGDGASFVGTPENVFLMEAPGQGKRVLYTESEHPGILAAIDMAIRHKVSLLIGSVAVKIDDSGKAMNRSLLIGSQGEIAARYDKIHLFDVTLANGETYAESDRFLRGDNASLGKIDGVTLGLTICYDVRFPHLYRVLAKAGASIIAVPAAFTATTGEGHWEVLLRARAIETGSFIIAPAQTGTHPGDRKTFGHALIVDPWGKVLADAGTEEGIILADIDVNESAQIRSRIPSLAHERAFSLPAGN